MVVADVLKNGFVQKLISLLPLGVIGANSALSVSLWTDFPYLSGPNTRQRTQRKLISNVYCSKNLAMHAETTWWAILTQAVTQHFPNVQEPKWTTLSHRGSTACTFYDFYLTLVRNRFISFFCQNVRLQIEWFSKDSFRMLGLLVANTCVCCCAAIYDSR